ncbi:MAG: hypothetical protein IKQ71_07545 [Lachnospiraceae bacterium]|nr:hypothetical protein [Lachnospiraceae bacterium]
MQYEDLFTDRVSVGSNIEAIMRDRRCTKVKLSKEIKVSRPTLDAILKGEIHNATKYSEYIRRLLNFFQVSDTVLSKYQSLPKLDRMKVVSFKKEAVMEALGGLNIPVFIWTDGDFNKLMKMVEKSVAKGTTIYALSYVRGIEKVISQLAKKHPDHIIGVANVIDKVTVGMVADCGAQFIVTPGVSEEIVAFCKARDMLLISGVVTPTDVISLSHYGGDLACLYPYEKMDKYILKSLKILDSDMRFCCMKTNGKIDPGNVDDVFALLYYVEK